MTCAEFVDIKMTAKDALHICMYKMGHHRARGHPLVMVLEQIDRRDVALLSGLCSES